jgi:hypothetical protein
VTLPNRDNVLVRLLASDEPGAWLNVRSSSVMVPFFTLEAALILVSILSSRFLVLRLPPIKPFNISRITLTDGGGRCW